MRHDPDLRTGEHTLVFGPAANASQSFNGLVRAAAERNGCKSQRERRFTLILRPATDLTERLLGLIGAAYAAAALGIHRHRASDRQK
jgi:hypothetical protein